MEEIFLAWNRRPCLPCVVRSTPTKIASIAYLFWIFWGPFHSTLPNRGLRTSAAGTREVEEEEEGSKQDLPRLFLSPFSQPGQSARTLIRAFFPPPCLCLWGGGGGGGRGRGRRGSEVWQISNLCPGLAPPYFPGVRRSGHPPPEKGEEVGKKGWTGVSG